MIRYLATILILFCSSISSAWAGDTRFSVFAITNHVNTSHVNDIHPMLQIEYDRRWVGGVYLNSHNDASFYFARRLQSKIQPFRPFVEIGAVTGYSRPLMRSLRIGVEINNHLDFVIMPEFDGDSLYRVRQPVGVLGLILKF